jgi:N-acetylmuramoyl-L-alanine amidase
MGRYWNLFIFLLYLLFSSAHADDVLRVNGIRYWSTADQSRITLDVSDTANQSKVQFFDNPARLVIDLPKAIITKELAPPPASHPLFSSIRVGMRSDGNLRIVMDLKKSLSTKTTNLRTDFLGTNRFVVELLDKDIANNLVAKNENKLLNNETKPLSNSPQPSSQTNTKASTPPPASSVASTDNKVISNANAAPSAVKAPVIAKSPPPEPKLVADKTNKLLAVRNETQRIKQPKPFAIAIDAGHGGNDSGAQGLHGTYEKDVVFSIAKKLEALINAQSNMKAIMVRQGDYYIGLRKRMDIARAAKADIFISIHADSIKDNDASGASVYALSNSGASSESAYWRAHSENAADLVEGEQINNEENALTNVLLDLSQSATQEASVQLANKVLQNFESFTKLHFDSVQKAGFAVLKSPEIPSILVETAFISNPAEEMKLLNTGYQLKIATAILKGITSYIKQPTNEQRIASLEIDRITSQ